MMGDVVRIVPKREKDTSLTNRMRSLCASLDHPHPEARELDTLNRMQETLDALYEQEYARRKEQC